VQYSAHLTGHVGWFEDYCVLGDDIVIADTAVGERYLKVMTALGVEINLSKSLQSSKGVFEFAKRIATPTEEYSPLPWGAYYQAMKSPTIMPTFVRWLISRGFDLSPLSLATAAPCWFGIPRMLYTSSTRVDALPTTVQLVLVELVMRGAPWFVREGLLLDMFDITLEEFSSAIQGGDIPYNKKNPGGLFESLREQIMREVRISCSPLKWIQKILPSEEASPTFVGGFLRPIVTLVSPYGICSYYRWVSLIRELYSSFRAVVARGRIRFDLGILWREMITHLLLSYVIRKDTKTPYGLWSAASKYVSILPQPPKIRTETDRVANTSKLSNRLAARTLRTYARHVLRIPPR
jgi:hypothetical protein